MQLLPDPSKVMIAGDEWVISHGDALCTNDLSYQVFRTWVRKPWLQKLFLRLPLDWRRGIARTLRSNSTAKYERAARYTPDVARYKGDVTLVACANLMGVYGSERLIHGHTHLPARHHESMGSKEWQRYVLSDWDLDHPETVLPKASALRIDLNGVRYIDLIKST